ncbi:MAG TPA: hypothetical protein VK152_09345, partial [Paludibacter sp.]|nr:hypothetical protein [Paludibacter sp.]
MAVKKTTFIILLISAIISVYAKDEVRIKTSFNRDWKFQLGDPKNAEKSEYDDKTWQNVGLPHSFSTPYFMSPDFYVGYGWYRKQFDVPVNFTGKKLFLEFEAAFQDAEVFVNGKKAGGHKGGYTAFS